VSVKAVPISGTQMLQDEDEQLFRWKGAIALHPRVSQAHCKELGNTNWKPLLLWLANDGDRASQSFLTEPWVGDVIKTCRTSPFIHTHSLSLPRK